MLAALAGFVGKEADKMEFIRRQTAGGQSGNQGAGSGDRFNPKPGADGRAVSLILHKNSRDEIALRIM